jgi:periplasmic copper chaperone A
VRGLATTAALLAAACAACAACAAARAPAHDGGTIGVDSEIGPILLRAVHAPAPGGGRYPAGSDATVMLTLVNESDTTDALVFVETPDAERVEIRWDRRCDGTAEVVPLLPLAPAEIPLSATAEAAGAQPFDPYSLWLVNLHRTVLAGTEVPLVFTFQRAGRLATAAYVQPSRAPLPEPSRNCSSVGATASRPSGGGA